MNTDIATASLGDIVVGIKGTGTGLTQDQVSQLRKRIYADGQIDRDEFNTLFAINDVVSGRSNHESWQPLFVEACSQHVLGDRTSPGEVDEDEATLLISLINSDGQVDDTEAELLITLCEKAKSIHQALVTFTMTAIGGRIMADEEIDNDEVDQVRRVIYGAGGSGGQDVSYQEFRWLTDLNNACSGSTSSSWKTLFTEAVGNFCLRDQNSPGVIDPTEAEQIRYAFYTDGQLDEVEVAALQYLQRTAKPGSASTMQSLYDAANA